MDNLHILMNGVFGRKVPAEFAAADYDYEAALRDELAKLMTKDGHTFNRNIFEKNKWDIFELLSDNLEEVLPRSIESALDMFTETIYVKQGDRLEFRVRRGHMRGRQFVTRATESGNYETFRLDHDRFDVYPQAIGGATTVDFERYLDGLEEMGELYQILQEGIVDRLFEMVQDILLRSWNAAGRPANNKVAANSFDTIAMQQLCNTIRPYGDPIIYCTAEFAADMVNAIIYNVNSTTTVKLSDQDMQEVRDRGYVGKFYGTPVVIMPQSWTDETNSKLVMNPSFAYVLPAGREKLIKLGFEGQPQVREWDDHEGDNSFGIQAYVKVGIGMFTAPNYWGIYYNAALDDGSGWAAYNQALVPTLDDGTANN